MRKWLIVTGFALSFFIAPTVLAQTVAPSTADDGLPAHLFVRNLTLEKQEYPAGAQVRGSFTLYNPDERIVSDASYVIRLQGIYGPNGQANVIYDLETYGPVAVPAGGEVPIDFAYQLPQAVAGNVGIQAQAMLMTGLPLGWQDVQFAIVGEPKFLDVGLAVINIGDKEFGVEEGPTVERAQAITASASLHNGAKQPITVTPVVTIYNRSIATEPLETKKHDPITVGPDEVKTITLPLPTFDYTPRVYAGTVEFVSADGQPQGNPITLRYIVGGEIAVIERISTSQQSVRTGEEIYLVADVSASPVHVGVDGKPTIQRVGPATFKIQVFNEKDQLVGQTLKTVDLDDPTPHRAFTIAATGDAQQLKIRSTLVKGDTELASYKTDLPPAGQPTTGAAEAGQRVRSLLVVIVGIVVLLAMALYLIGRKNKV